MRQAQPQSQHQHHRTWDTSLRMMTHTYDRIPDYAVPAAAHIPVTDYTSDVINGSKRGYLTSNGVNDASRYRPVNAEALRFTSKADERLLYSSPLQHQARRPASATNRLETTAHDSLFGTEREARLASDMVPRVQPERWDAVQPPVDRLLQPAAGLADDSWAALTIQAPKVYTADQFEHPAKMARLPLSQWEKSNIASSVRFQTSVREPRRYQINSVNRSSSADIDRWSAPSRVRHGSADDQYAFKRYQQGRSASSSPVSFENARIGHNLRARPRINGPLAGRHKQDMLDRMIEQQNFVEVKERFRQAARDVINNILLVDSGKTLTADQKIQRDLAFKLLDEAFPLAHSSSSQNNKSGIKSRPHSSHSLRNEVLHRGAEEIPSHHADNDYVIYRGVTQMRAWDEKKDSGQLWQQSLSPDEHELLIDALRSELGLLNNGAKHH